jgi:DNA-binding transcriptional LysR family regulator
LPEILVGDEEGVAGSEDADRLLEPGEDLRLGAAEGEEALRAGTLVSLLDRYASPPTPVHLLHVGGRHVPPRTRAFLDFAHPRLAQAFADAGAV